ncbi:hypothetical protein TEQG_08831 [Trichophyton equinum CBS 127.97]|uniref:Uncharacterized protein n=1 Tax=Trichophyton equinum (strain ATCC MYA-4606 / CBS 127.97) TaxID=559882 RepID=F2Q4H6_TRIEC|nr:hypothetical protein TEQG_08831 [Trichophyton equinum CBS 127.97]
MPDHVIGHVPACQGTHNHLYRNTLVRKLPKKFKVYSIKEYKDFLNIVDGFLDKKSSGRYLYYFNPIEEEEPYLEAFDTIIKVLTVYLDNILIFSNILEDHKAYLITFINIYGIIRRDQKGGYFRVKKTIEAIKNILTKFALYIPYTKDVKAEGLEYLIFKNLDRALEPNYRALPKSQYSSTSEALAVALIDYKPKL